MKTLVCTLLSKNTLFLLCLLSISTSYGQVLQIISSGETGTSSTNWSISGNTLTVTGTANIQASVIENHLTYTGSLTIVGNTTPSNLQVSVNEAINVSSGNNSLVIGASDNKGGITTTQTITLSGSISFHGGWVRLENNVETTGSGAKILAKANESGSPVNVTDGFISLSLGTDLTTSGGDIILWSNATNKTSGQANNEIILLGTNELSTSGGKIVIAGGLDDGSNGGTVSDGIPDGYAYRGSYGGRPIDIKASVTLNSGGGEIIIRGEQNGSDAAVGADATFTISNGGAVTIEGKNTTATSVVLGTANIASTATNAPVTISGTTHITNSGLTTIVTQGGDVLLASNVDDATDGESVTNGYIRLGSGLSVTTNGGDITIGGGDATGSGYALGRTDDDSFTEGVRVDATLVLNSGGGDIGIRGKSSTRSLSISGAGNAGFGVYSLTSAGEINSGTGTITIEGINQNPNFTNYSSGIIFALNGGNAVTIRSANTTANAISISASATGPNAENFGMEVETNSPLSVAATGLGGGITLTTSQASTATNKYDFVVRSPLDILANGGPITLSGSAGGIWYVESSIDTYLGRRASSLVETSSSAITVEFDRYNFNSGRPYVGTSGAVTVRPASTSFGAAFSTDWFLWNQNPLHMTGLTIGKVGNTTNVSHDTQDVTVAGPIEVYGGTISVNANLTTTSGSGGDISLYTDNNLGLSSARTITADGAFKLIPNSPSFSNIISYPITNLNVISKGLTIGKSGNTADINIMQAQTIAGPISVYGGNIGINENLNTSAGAADGDVLLKASGNNNLANGKSITTSGGDVTFWSDSDGNGTGYAQVGSATAITTAGGNITLGGGSDIATGYARGAVERDAETDNVNILHISGVHLKNGASLSSGGGNITLRGQNYLSSALTIDFGVMGHNATLDAGSGKVAIIGKATGSGNSNTQAISVYDNGWTILSSNSDADAIVLNGDGSGYNGNTTTLGINFAGIIESTGGGGIQLTGKSGTSTGYDHPLDMYGSILANSGTITITAENNDATQTGLFLSGATLGFKSATNVQASTSNIILKSDNTVFNSATNLNTTGAVSLLPLDASPSFGVAQTIGSNMVLSSGVSGLTIGKDGNTANVTLSSALSVAGPISVYGGTIAVNADLTTTSSGNISLYSDNQISFSNSPDITASGAFEYIPRSTSFSSDVTYPLSGASVSSNGLTIGKSGNTSNITFSGDYSTNGNVALYGTTISTGNLTVGSGANFTLEGSLTLSSGETLDVDGYISNGGTITVENGASIVQGTPSGSGANSGSGFTMKRTTGTLPDDSRFQYWSSPVQNATMGTVFTGANTNDFYGHNESSTTNNGWVSQAPTAIMTPGRGYITTGTLGISNASETRTFSGAINNGAINVSVNASTADHILVGNPYPSAISAVTFASDNSSLYGTYYFWDHSTNPNTNGGQNFSTDYASWNASGGTSNGTGNAPTGYIGAMQGFFVEAQSATSTVVFNNAQRVSGNNTQFFKTDTRERAWFSLEANNGMQNQILVARVDEATDGFDSKYDGRKLQGNPDLGFYSMLNQEQLAIQALSKANSDQTIPLGLNSTVTGTMTIQLDSTQNWPTDRAIMLYDAMLNQTIDLQATDYTFQWSFAGEMNDRFFLNLETSQVGTEEQGATDASWYWYQQGEQLHIEGAAANIESLTLRNTQGQVVQSVRGAQSMRVDDLSPGIYTLEATSDRMVSTQKVILN